MAWTARGGGGALPPPDPRARAARGHPASLAASLAAAPIPSETSFPPSGLGSPPNREGRLEINVKNLAVGGWELYRALQSGDGGLPAPGWAAL